MPSTSVIYKLTASLKGGAVHEKEGHIRLDRNGRATLAHFVSDHVTRLEPTLTTGNRLRCFKCSDQIVVRNHCRFAFDGVPVAQLYHLNLD